MRYKKQMMNKYPLSVYVDDTGEWFAIDTINTINVKSIKRCITTHIRNDGGDLSVVTHNEDIKLYMDAYIHKVNKYIDRLFSNV